MCEANFIKADSSNLPQVDLFMVMKYFNKSHDFLSTEMRGVKITYSLLSSSLSSRIVFVAKSAFSCIISPSSEDKHTLKSKSLFNLSKSKLNTTQTLPACPSVDCSSSTS
ncbi:hypothetical protein RI129_004873 [Pyrocoelia pectoralis]|uniref:Uncharacterized protein n=1 Tax=Pyrocoelia pectoralis TaxID=417401 RepID=A0AAN7VLQ1_9COLE